MKNSNIKIVLINFLTLLTAISQTISEMWHIYWQTRKLNSSHTQQAISTKIFPLVSIVICTDNRPSLLERAIKSLEMLSYKNFEVIVIDSSSNTETTQIVNTWLSKNSFKLHYAKIEPKNISYSRNMGVKMALGTIVAFCDDNTIVPSQWLDELVLKYSEYGDKCAAVGGTVRDLSRPNSPLQFCRGITNVLSETIALRPNNYINYNRANGFWYNALIGTNSSFRKDSLEKINGYDEFLDYFLDETDVCLRLIQAGYQVHYADVTVYHFSQPSHNRVDQKHLTCWYSLAKNTAYFAFKHGFKKVPCPIFFIRLALLLTYRCFLRIICLKFTHRLPNSTLIKYIQQAYDGIRVGLWAGLNLHKANLKSHT